MGGGAENVAKHALEWRGRPNRPNVPCFGAVPDLPNLAPQRRSGLREGAVCPETPSAVYAKMRFGAPVYARVGFCENGVLAYARRSLLEAPGAPRAALETPQHEPLKLLWEVPGAKSMHFKEGLA